MNASCFDLTNDLKFSALSLTNCTEFKMGTEYFTKTEIIPSGSLEWIFAGTQSFFHYYASNLFNLTEACELLPLVNALILKYIHSFNHL